MWVARVQWRDADGQKKKNRFFAHEVKSNSERAFDCINRVEVDIKTGMEFTFLR